MNLLSSLPRNERGEVAIPIAAKRGDTELPGTVDETWISANFTEFVGKDVPLNEADYQVLLAASTPMWQLNWHRFREQGII